MNMFAQHIEFEPEYTSALLSAAATAFVRGYLFATYGRWLVMACIINAAGFGLIVWLGGGGGSAWFAGALALIGPVWLANFYLRYPAKFATRASRSEPPTRIALTPDNVELISRSGSAKVPWSRFRAVVEAPTAFLLVVSPFGYLPLPKQGMPPEAISLLHNRRSSNVA